jgi:ferric-dicitrate binding protein FerR (iron transport regulator)
MEDGISKDKNAYNRAWRKKNLAHARAWSREYAKTAKAKASKLAYRIRRRKEVLQQYGGICACCGETRWQFLAIDHIEGHGNAHRKMVGEGYQFYQWLRNNNFPKGFRVLCHNCNTAIGHWGKCPHQEGG